MFIQPAAFQQPFRTIPENKGTVFGIAHFTQLVDTNAGISCGFFQRQMCIRDRVDADVFVELTDEEAQQMGFPF